MCVMSVGLFICSVVYVETLDGGGDVEDCQNDFMHLR